MQSIWILSFLLVVYVQSEPAMRLATPGGHAAPLFAEILELAKEDLVRTLKLV